MTKREAKIIAMEIIGDYAYTGIKYVDITQDDFGEERSEEDQEKILNEVELLCEGMKEKAWKLRNEQRKWNKKFKKQ